MKTLFYSGLTFTSFSLVQLLSFAAASYPKLTHGCVLLLLGVGTCIFLTGFSNWVGLYNRSFRHDKAILWAGFAPAIVLGGLFFVAIACGAYTALGGMR